MKVQNVNLLLLLLRVRCSVHEEEIKPGLCFYVMGTVWTRSRH